MDEVLAQAFCMWRFWRLGQRRSERNNVRTPQRRTGGSCSSSTGPNFLRHQFGEGCQGARSSPSRQRKLLF